MASGEVKLKMQIQIENCETALGSCNYLEEILKNHIDG